MKDYVYAVITSIIIIYHNVVRQSVSYVAKGGDLVLYADDTIQHKKKAGAILP